MKTEQGYRIPGTYNYVRFKWQLYYKSPEHRKKTFAIGFFMVIGLITMLAIMGTFLGAHKTGGGQYVTPKIYE